MENTVSDLRGDLKSSAQQQDVDVTVVGGDQFMSYKKRYVTVAILFLVNLLNYMDRYTVAGVLTDVQQFYGIGDGDSGLLQAIFVVGFMATSPVFGYCGDRYNRKWLMVGGIGLWSAVTLGGSFIPKDHFWLFVTLRGFVGIGEASYSTIAPTLISDMFVKEKRSTMLMIFYFAIPVGSGLGYIVGAYVAQAFGAWQWAFRVTPVLGTVCCLLLAIVTQDPPRGMAEDGVDHHSSNTIKQDLKSLGKNKTFILTTAGNTCVTFISGALALFAPTFLVYAYRVSGDYMIAKERVSLYMGIVTTAAGFSGVALGTEVAKRVKRVHQNGDPLVCAFGLLSGMPFLFLGLILCEYNMIATWILILISEILIFMNWALVADMLLYTVAATRRSTAEAAQIFISHLLGDAASPFLLGFMSDSFKHGDRSVYVAFKSLQKSLYLPLFIGVFGGGCFLITSLFITKDKEQADKETKGLVRRSPVSRPLPLDDMVPLFDDEESSPFDDNDDVPMLQVLW